MSFANRVCQTLHEEHRATIGLMERLESLITRHRRGGAPDVNEMGVRQLLNDLSASMRAEVERHFAFEEQRLFSYLGEIGDEAIGAHLTEEHSVIRPMGLHLAELAQEALANGFDQARWEAFRRIGSELCDHMLTHVQKEEMALLPLLEENMDSEAEMRLYEEYAATT